LYESSVNLLAMGLHTNAQKKTNKNHFFATPDWIVNQMCDLIPDGAKRIIEPCCGTGAISSELECRGYDVGKFELDPEMAKQTGAIQGDFLASSTSEMNGDCTVINPPYMSMLHVKFIKKCLSHTPIVIAIVPNMAYHCKELGLAEYIADEIVNLEFMRAFGLQTSQLSIFVFDRNNPEPKTKEFWRTRYLGAEWEKTLNDLKHKKILSLANAPIFTQDYVGNNDYRVLAVSQVWGSGEWNRFWRMPEQEWVLHDRNGRGFQKGDPRNWPMVKADTEEQYKKHFLDFQKEIRYGLEGLIPLYGTEKTFVFGRK
jgi:hypothetical protein